MDEAKRAAFGNALRGEVRGEVLLDATRRGVYATDASIYEIIPAAVVLPRDERDVLRAIRIAADHGVSVLPRGGGTSLGGQAVGPGMVLDFTKHMNAVLATDIDARRVRCQPGVVLDELNARLAPHGLHFAPDPATSSRATIGGMLGNNSSGAKSLVYGIMKDHVTASRFALADGTVLALAEWDQDEWARRAAAEGREAQLLAGVSRIVDAHRDAIRDAFPKLMRRVQGYNLDAFIDPGPRNLTKLLIGSEGTLGVFLDATLRLEPLPKYKAMCVVHFDDVLDAIRAVRPILAHGPSAVEIMDDDVLGQARSNLALAPLCGFVEGDPAAVLAVEFFGETPDDAGEKCQKLAAALRRDGTGYACPIFTDPAEQANVWAVRKHGLGLLLARTDGRKPIPVIEDCTVPVEHLPEYIARVKQFCAARDIPVAVYAHASVGTIHVRPMLDLKRQRDVDLMRELAETAFVLVREADGSWSGEHGDGRVRSPFLQRYFGEEVYGALREVKRLFDPAGLMNPGPIIDPEPMDAHLRLGADYRTPEVPTFYHYRHEGSFAAAAEMCNGVGACRATLAGTMCPSFRATRDEEHSTRGRANALRLAMTGKIDHHGLAGEGVREVLDLCLACKACKAECPSNVDMARLKGEVLQKRYDLHGTALRDRLIANSPRAARMTAGIMAPLVNAIQRTRPFRWMMERVAGFDRRRPLPAYARRPFGKWFARNRRPSGGNGERPRVVLFDDTYMNFHQPRIGIGAVELLESCGYEVILARAGCCQRPRISHGFLRDAKRDGEVTLRNLDAYVADGLEIVVCEPGCASALTDDLPDLIDDEALGRRVRRHVHMIDEWLLGEVRAGRVTGPFTSPFERVLIHGHCHQKALFGTTAMTALLAGVEGLNVSEVPSGCCGMAGSFGYEAEHYDLSMAVGEDVLFPAIRGRSHGTAVVACGFSCRHQIADGTGVEAVHFVEAIRGCGSGAHG